MDSRFGFTHYVIRRKVFRLLGGAFHLFGPDGQLVLYSEQARFRMKEDIRLYGSEAMTDELLSIKARQVIDISPTFDVIDMRTGEAVGSLRRRGLRSAIADEWTILDPAGNEVGSIKEDSVALALVRRLLANMLPQTFRVRLGSRWWGSSGSTSTPSCCASTSTSPPTATVAWTACSGWPPACYWPPSKAASSSRKKSGAFAVL